MACQLLKGVRCKVRKEMLVVSPPKESDACKILLGRCPKVVSQVRKCIFEIYFVNVFLFRLGQLLFSFSSLLPFSLKPNSHQTIFPTNFQRHPTIEKSVVIG